MPAARSIKLVSLLSVAALLLVGCGPRFRTHRVVEIPTSAPVDVTIKTNNGDIDIAPHPAGLTGWAQGQIETGAIDPTAILVVVELAGNDLDRLESVDFAPVISDAGELTLEIDWPGGKAGWFERASFSVRVADPMASIDVQSGNGDVIVSDLDGDAKVRSGNGDLVIRGLTGELIASTGNGDVVLLLADDADDKLDIRSGNGDLVIATASPTTAGFDIRSGNGDILIKHATGNFTGGFSKKIDAAEGMPTHTIRTGNGDIVVDVADSDNG